jgi:hypothetical protein
MKSLSFLLGLFFWGMVLKCLSEAMDISAAFTQCAVKWMGYGLWGAALVLLVYRAFWSGAKKHEVTQTEESRP